jgi:hypothetical protein
VAADVAHPLQVLQEQTLCQVQTVSAAVVVVVQLTKVLLVQVLAAAMAL